MSRAMKGAMFMRLSVTGAAQSSASLSGGLRRAGCPDNLNISACRICNLFGLAGPNRLHVNQVSADPDCGRTGFDKAGGSLQADAAGRHQFDLRQRRLERFDITGAAHGAGRKYLDEVGAGIPSRNNFSGCQRARHDRDVAVATERYGLEVECRANDESSSGGNTCL